MKLLTNGVYRVHPAMREQVMQHIGPAGLRRFTQAVADYDVPSAQVDSDGGTWQTSFVAGDLISIVAGNVGGGPMEIAVLDVEGRPVALSACPNGHCYAGAKIPHSGVYSVRVRHVPLAHLLGDPPPPEPDAQHRPAPFKLCCTRQLPRVAAMRLTTLRKNHRPQAAPGVLQRLLGRFAPEQEAEIRGRTARPGYA